MEGRTRPWLRPHPFPPSGLICFGTGALSGPPIPQQLLTRWGIFVQNAAGNESYKNCAEMPSLFLLKRTLKRAVWQLPGCSGPGRLGGPGRLWGFQRQTRRPTSRSAGADSQNDRPLSNKQQGSKQKPESRIINKERNQPIKQLGKEDNSCAGAACWAQLR